MSATIGNRQRLHPVVTSRLKRLAQRALDLLDDSDANLSLVLVSDTGSRRLNREFHATDAPTDVLAFDYGDGELEVIVSVERAVTVARRYRSTPARELVLYLVHGLLHLHGYDDRTSAQRRRMRAAERRLLRRLTAEFPLRGLVR